MTGASSTQVRTDRIVVAGLPRSGTTYVGKILEQHPDIRMVLEPLNAEFGLRAVEGRFPYVSESDFSASGDAAALLDQMVDLRGGWRRLRQNRGGDRSLVRKVAKVAIGSKTSLDWRLDRLAESAGKPRAKVQCLKDPFATFALPYLGAAHGIRSICMVRHPGAYYNSFATQPWDFGTKRLLNGGGLRRDFGEGIDDELWNAANEDKRAYCAVMWKLMSRSLAETPSEVLTVRHEDLSRDVVTNTERICEHMGLEIVPSMRDYIEVTSGGTSVASEYLQVRSFVRDSKALVDHWRESIDPADAQRLREIVGDDLSRFYEDW